MTTSELVGTVMLFGFVIVLYVGFTIYVWLEDGWKCALGWTAFSQFTFWFLVTGACLAEGACHL